MAPGRFAAVLQLQREEKQARALHEQRLSEWCRDAPAVHLPRRQCGNCAAEDVQLFRCVRCKSIEYCGRACQQAHWPAHKVACRAARADDPSAVLAFAVGTDAAGGREGGHRQVDPWMGVVPTDDEVRSRTREAKNLAREHAQRGETWRAAKCWSDCAIHSMQAGQWLAAQKAMLACTRYLGEYNATHTLSSLPPEERELHASFEQVVRYNSRTIETRTNPAIIKAHNLRAANLAGIEEAKDVRNTSHAIAKTLQVIEGMQEERAIWAGLRDDRSVECSQVDMMIARLHGNIRELRAQHPTHHKV